MRSPLGTAASCIVWNPNPTLDVASDVARLALGEVHAASEQTISPGGKGTLLVQALRRLGTQVSGIAPVAGDSGRLFAALADRLGLPIELSEVDGMTRVAVSIADSGRREATVVNGPGPTAVGDAWNAHIARVEQMARSRDLAYFVVAGRPPLTAPPELTARVCQLAADAGARTVVDLATPVLEAVLPTKPWLVKVNFGESISAGSGGDNAEQAVRGLRRLGAQNAIVTDGGGVLAADLLGEKRSLAPPHVSVRSAVGCGDCFLAGLLDGLLKEDPVQHALLRGVAVASASAETIMPGDFDPARVDDILRSLMSRDQSRDNTPRSSSFSAESREQTQAS